MNIETVTMTKVSYVPVGLGSEKHYIFVNEKVEVLARPDKAALKAIAPMETWDRDCQIVLRNGKYHDSFAHIMTPEVSCRHPVLGETSDRIYNIYCVPDYELEAAKLLTSYVRMDFIRRAGMLSGEASFLMGEALQLSDVSRYYPVDSI